MSATPLKVLMTPRGRDAPEPPLSSLGRSIAVKGILDTEGALTIHGTVQGRIHAERLVVAAGATVEGDVVAREVEIGGRFDGRIFALNVALSESADVTGRIFHNTVSVARGARVDARMPWRPPSYFETLDQLPETRP